MFSAHTVRKIRLCAIAFAIAGSGWTVAAASTASDAAGRSDTAGQGSPLWAQRTLFSSSRASVSSVVSTATADIVLLGGGHNEGFRDGMTCEVRRGGEPIAELMIVRCEAERSAALITALKAGTEIHSGDVANIKTVHPF